MSENWNIIVKNHECPHIFIEDGYRYCFFEDGPRYCNQDDCPISKSADKSCPLYTDYRKSCQALKDRDAELATNQRKA